MRTPRPLLLYSVRVLREKKAKTSGGQRILNKIKEKKRRDRRWEWPTCGKIAEEILKERKKKDRLQEREYTMADAC